MNRPRYLDLLRIHQFLPAWASILHRISGLLLFLFLPALLLLLQTSMESEAGFETASGLLRQPVAKLALLLLLWAFLHHLLAGIRLLLIDLGIGVALPGAHRSSLAVIVLSLGISVLLAWAW
jgi:succinate dehydrogenase cytochrome b subunit